MLVEKLGNLRQRATPQRMQTIGILHMYILCRKLHKYFFIQYLFSPGDCGTDGCMSTVLHRLRLTLYNIKTYVHLKRTDTLYM